MRKFGRSCALTFVSLADAYERLWEIYDLPLLPQEWVKQTTAQRREVGTMGRTCLDQFRQRLDELRRSATGRHGAWLRHLALFGTYFDYHLRRLERFSEMLDLVTDNQQILEKGQPLDEPLRQRLLAMHREVYDLADAYDREAATMPAQMIARTRANQLTRPWKEWVGGYDASLDGLLKVRQFAGRLTASPEEISAGRPFTLRVHLRNTGVWPWTSRVGPRLETRGEAGRVGLPDAWQYEGAEMVFGDARTIELRGTAPKEPGQTALRFLFYAPYRSPQVLVDRDVTLRWK